METAWKRETHMYFIVGKHARKIIIFPAEHSVLPRVNIYLFFATIWTVFVLIMDQSRTKLPTSRQTQLVWFVWILVVSRVLVLVNWSHLVVAGMTLDIIIQLSS